MGSSSGVTNPTAEPGSALNIDTDTGIDLGTVRSDVTEWGMGQLRDLPWRRSRDPWAILVSEVMLQQTQVGRVLERWPEFLAAFPTPAACAAAPLADVLALWTGLGYPRRARALWESARVIAEAGSFPDTLDGLLALPGVGPYTARALLAFAFEADAAVVDTNIARVLARVVGRSLRSREVQALADELVPPGDAWRWNQTLMDVGAVHCRRVPVCEDCPLARSCVWHGDGSVPDPAVKSAHVSTRQAPFEGSDRQARGRLMAELAVGPVDVDRIAEVMGRDEATAERLLDALIGDGLCVADGGAVRLGEGRRSSADT